MAAPASGAEAIARAFESYKEANDARLAAIEQGRADVLLDEKVDRIDRALVEQKAAIERLALAARRPALAADPRESEYKSAWGAYLRRGDESAVARFEGKSLSIGGDAGFTAPPELDRLIEVRLKAASPMRGIATVITTSANVFKKPVATAHSGSNWVAETAARSETSTPTLAVIDFPTAELYANLAATQALLEDAYVNIEEWIAGEVEEAFSAQERLAFVDGDGVNKPKGFLRHTTVVDASHAWDKIGYLATGVAGAFPASNPVDKLLDLVFAPKAQFRQNARFVLNRKTLAAIRKLKDASGNYIWQPTEGGAGSSILGYPVAEIEEMPDIAADKFAIAFGDFQRGYLIVDRAGVRVLRDPFTAKPYVLFYVTKRVGGGVQNFDAIKLLKFGVS